MNLPQFPVEPCFFNHHLNSWFNFSFSVIFSPPSVQKNCNSTTNFPPLKVLSRWAAYFAFPGPGSSELFQAVFAVMQINDALIHPATPRLNARSRTNPSTCAGNDLCNIHCPAAKEPPASITAYKRKPWLLWIWWPRQVYRVLSKTSQLLLFDLFDSLLTE